MKKDPSIIIDRQKLELSRIKSRDSKSPKEHQIYLEDKKQRKETIKDKKNSFSVKRCHQKVLKPYGILLIVYSINNRKE